MRHPGEPEGDLSTGRETAGGSTVEMGWSGRWQLPSAAQLAVKVLLFGAVCFLSTRLGFANKVPPHNISALWPTIAILFAALVVSPVKHWWLYILAAYAPSIFQDAQAGFPPAARWFVAAGLIEVLVASWGVRRFASGSASFDNLRSLVAYIAIAVVTAPLIGAFVAAFAAPSSDYWLYWRVWLLSESLAYLTLAPVVLTFVNAYPPVLADGFLVRGGEAAMIAVGLVAVCLAVFHGPPSMSAHVPALVYLPLPFVLWPAIRFGPPGATAAILIVTTLSISGAVKGLGPFAGSSENNVVSLQIFLFVSSLPLIFLATLIEERRRAESEAALQREEVAHLTRVQMLGELSGSIAHEINQPLGAIRLNAEAALQMLSLGSPDVGKVGGALEDIISESERARMVIHRLRNLMRKGERRSEPVDINELVDSSAAMLGAELLARGVTPRIAKEASDASVLGDPIQLQQVILNLIMNAVDAMAATETAQRVITLATRTTGAGEVEVEVRDHGPGIPLAGRDRLFEPFYTTKENGLGLGLAICTTILAAHGGTLSLANGEGGGAVAKFRLPHRTTAPGR
jgi:signal transduction histidine kinase